MQPKTDEAPFARRSPLGAFLKSEAAGGVLLMISAALALIIANSPVAPLYFATLGSYVAGLSILHWINDALMAVFFLLVGLEIAVDDAEAAGLRHGDRHPGLRHRVHGGGDDRQVQRDGLGAATASRLRRYELA
eukprot:gene5367-biopygen4521